MVDNVRWVDGVQYVDSAQVLPEAQRKRGPAQGPFGPFGASWVSRFYDVLCGFRASGLFRLSRVQCVFPSHIGSRYHPGTKGSSTCIKSGSFVFLKAMS